SERGAAREVGGRQPPNVPNTHVVTAKSGLIGAGFGRFDVVCEDARKVWLQSQPGQAPPREKLIKWGAGITLHAAIIACRGGLGVQDGRQEHGGARCGHRSALSGSVQRSGSDSCWRRVTKTRRRRVNPQVHRPPTSNAKHKWRLINW